MKQKLGWFKLMPAGLAIKLILISLVRKLFRLPVTFSFSQGAEDIIAPYLLNNKAKGVYVDIGCNEPVRFSNTFNYYLQGWRGILVDANKELIKKCARIRKQDTVICAAVSDTVKEVTFHKSTESAVSTIDEERLKEWEKLWKFEKADQETVITRTLTGILDENLKGGQQVDLLSVDVEGHDFEVLKGLDFNKYRPKVIIIECHTIVNIGESRIYNLLSTEGYELKGFAVLNAYYVDTKPVK